MSILIKFGKGIYYHRTATPLQITGGINVAVLGFPFSIDAYFRQTYLLGTTAISTEIATLPGINQQIIYVHDCSNVYFENIVFGMAIHIQDKGQYQFKNCVFNIATVVRNLFHSGVSFINCIFRGVLEIDENGNSHQETNLNNLYFFEAGSPISISNTLSGGYVFVSNPKNNGTTWFYKWGPNESVIDLKLNNAGFGGESIEMAEDGGFIIGTSGSTIIKTDQDLNF